MSADTLAEEYEVLESIYPTELSKTSERDIRIDAEPDDLEEGEDTIKLALKVHYTDGYPDELPDLSFDVLEGELTDDELNGLLEGLRTVVSSIGGTGEENLGLAMVFTLVTTLRERLSELVRERAERHKAEEHEKERLAIEAEEAKTRGTPVTVESFKAWKTKFDAELAIKKAKAEEEKLKAMTPKEREEYKRIQGRLSGRQLFEKNKNLEDESLVEEGGVSVDISQYERTREEEQEEEDHVTFSDSD
ncbi:RWD-domain-containing protein [Schizophyllum commune Tattone D]|nr:RWD-domain-containing protein [Schizophyllum commune Loenen D]KAI5835052.1 RWD-domain-containing protein [Schizophyllum commune Tattone D]